MAQKALNDYMMDWLSGLVNGAAPVSDGFQGISRTRWIDVVANTLPTVAGSGTITFENPVFGVKVTSMMVSAGTMPLTAVNPIMRIAVDAANDAAAAILLPDTFPSGDPTADAGQITSFNIPLVYVPGTGSVSVDVNAALVADADAAVAASTNLRLLGYSCKESAAGAAVATFRIMHGATVAGGTEVATQELAANASETVWFGDDGIACANGISIDWIAGTVDVTLYYTTSPRVVAQINFPTAGIEIPVSRDGILRLDFAHDITGMTFILGVTALEEV